jgi:hypothetical protein
MSKGMGSTRSIAVVAVLVVMLAGVGEAQTPAAPPTPPPAVARQMDHANLRRHIYTMEGALARAVAYGAQRLNREIRNVMPEVMALSGEPQARGVYLEGYGIYFDVAVPVLNQVMMWSLRTMMGPDEGVISALSKLKSYVQMEKNPATRDSMQAMISRLELQLGTLSSVGSDQITPLDRSNVGRDVGAMVVLPDASKPDAAGNAAAAGTAPARVLDKKYFQDPNAINRAYTEAVQNALIDTIVDYAVPTSIKPHELLTIAARDNMQRDTLAPPDPYEEVITLLLSIKGSDLAAFRAGQIDAAEVRRRVQIREF